MKLNRKIRHNKVCHSHDLGSYTQGQGRNQVKRSTSCLSNNSKTTEANLTKFHRKIEHNEKVCCTQKLSSYAQGQGHNHVRGQIVFEIVLLINYSSTFDEASQKDKA